MQEAATCWLNISSARMESEKPMNEPVDESLPWNIACRIYETMQLQYI